MGKCKGVGLSRHEWLGTVLLEELGIEGTSTTHYLCTTSSHHMSQQDGLVMCTQCLRNCSTGYFERGTIKTTDHR